MTVVAELPPGSWPNGLACRGGYLYAADSSLGAIWRIPLGGGVVKPSKPWFKSDLLAPGDPDTDPSALGIGANGIAFRGANLYVAVSDFGRIVRIPISAQGKPGTPTVVCDAIRTAHGRWHRLRPARQPLGGNERRTRPPIRRAGLSTGSRRPARYGRSR